MTLKAEWARAGNVKNWEGKRCRGGERAPSAGQGLGSSDHPRGLSFPINEVGGNVPHPPPSEDGRGKVPGKGHERPTEPVQLGRGGAGQGRSLRAAGRGVEGQADRAWRPDWLGPAGRRGAQCVRLRSARLAGSRDHMSIRPVGARQPQPCSPAAARRRTTLTMSVCCCFFFRDYGSSKRKSGKGTSGRSSLQPPLPLRARAAPTLRRTFWGIVLARLPCGAVLPPSSADAP